MQRRVATSLPQAPHMHGRIQLIVWINKVTTSSTYGESIKTLLFDWQFVKVVLTADEG